MYIYIYIIICYCISLRIYSTWLRSTLRFSWSTRLHMLNYDGQPTTRPSTIYVKPATKFREFDEKDGLNSVAVSLRCIMYCMCLRVYCIVLYTHMSLYMYVLTQRQCEHICIHADWLWLSLSPSIWCPLWHGRTSLSFCRGEVWQIWWTWEGTN